MICLIRGNYANEFELQNYIGIKDLCVVTSHHPLTPISLPSTKLWSPTDLFNFPLKRQIFNRLIGGQQWLLGIKNLFDAQSGGSSKQNIFHTAETYTPYTHQAVKLRRSGAISKLICTCWETIPHNNEKFLRLRKWKQQAYQYVDIFHTPTQRAKQALIIEGVDPAKIVVIPYGVDLTRFKPKKRHKNIRPLVLTIARLEKEKGIKDLEAVASSLPHFDFKVIGRGSYVPVAKNITVSVVDYKDIHSEYQKADLFFLPSCTTATWEEQYGMVLVEAMATGLPVVTTSSGSIAEVVGNSGIIIKNASIAEMVKVISSTLADNHKLKSMSSSARIRAKKLYDSAKVPAKLSKLYL